MLAVTLPVPPTSNHAYRLGLRNGRPILFASTDLESFTELAWLECRLLEIPKRTPLSMTVRLLLTARDFGQSDIDGYLKPIIDAVCGSRRDQWVRTLNVTKELTPDTERVEVTIDWQEAPP